MVLGASYVVVMLMSPDPSVDTVRARIARHNGRRLASEPHPDDVLRHVIDALREARRTKNASDWLLLVATAVGACEELLEREIRGGS